MNQDSKVKKLTVSGSSSDPEQGIDFSVCHHSQAIQPLPKWTAEELVLHE
jgi:hypothetical protein